MNYLFIIVSLFMLVQALIESFGEAIFNTSPKNILIALFIGIALNSNLAEKNKN